MRRRGAACALILWCAAAQAAEPGAGGLEGRVVIRKDGAPREDRSNVVVYLEGVPAKKGRRTPATHRIVQRDRSFVPALTVIQKGDTVAFPNEDLIIHNVFSRSPAAEFDLGEYKQGVSRSVRFRKVGTVDIYCNRHPWMVAHLKVLDTGHFAVTGPDGAFRLQGVPPGRYTLVAWAPNAPEAKTQVLVRAADTSAVPTLVLTEEVPPPHLNKYGAPYDEYR